MAVDLEKLMQDKKLVGVKLWFYVEGEFARFSFRGDSSFEIPVLPDDGFLCGRGFFADGTGEFYGGDGWLVVGVTPHGLLCQTTGGDTPDPKRYPDCQFSRCRLAPSAIMHVASAEMQEATWP